MAVIKVTKDGVSNNIIGSLDFAKKLFLIQLVKLYLILHLLQKKQKQNRNLKQECGEIQS